MRVHLRRLGSSIRFVLLTGALLILSANTVFAQSSAFTEVPSAPLVQTSASAQASEYRIGPNDKLTIVVFEVKELTFEKISVDANGQLAFPLIGVVTVSGKTAAELSGEIARRLSERYLRDPHVSVLVAESAGQKVTVDGVVEQPGVYDIQPHTTLLKTVALAKGPGKDADLSRIAVFRQVDGRRMAARFDLRSIREGKAADPEIYPGDIVVVGGSHLRGVWREIVAALPAFAVFAWF